MRLLVVLVAILVAVSTAEIESKDETRELKELLSAVKHYLDKEETKEVRTGDVCTVEKIVYNSTSVQAQVNAGTGGQWTSSWINADTIQEYGYGEYEDCSRVIYEQDMQKKCWLYCDNPLAVKYVFDKPCEATWEEIADCVGNSLKLTSCGLLCINSDVASATRGPKCDVTKCVSYGLGQDCSLCPQIKVKFFCPGTPPSVDACCPKPIGANCGPKSDNLRTSLETLKGDERRDVVAGILEQVHDAMLHVDKN
jgi:hypothetical protein